MAAKRRFTDEQITSLKQLRAQGLSYYKIAAMVGADRRSVQDACNGYKRRKCSQHVHTVRGEWIELDREAERDWQKRRKHIPKGPTSLNQALLGDPLPGRSALDRMQSA